MEREELFAEREARRETTLRRAADPAGLDLAALPGQKMAPGKCLLAAALRRTASVSNGWLARRLGMGRPATASQGARRRMMGERGKRECERLAARSMDEASR